MTTVLIAAHNEAGIIGRTLDGLLNEGGDSSIRVVVAANGCTDDTAAVARRRHVEVVEVAEPGKAAALNAAEHGLIGYPRVYLDADVNLTRSAVEQLTRALRSVDDDSSQPAVLATVPARRVDASGSTVLVRMYYAVNARHPAYQTGLFGRGAIALSEDGRRRFTEFPEIIADDLFLDSLFGPGETAEVDNVVSVVRAVRSTRDLVRRLARVRRGNAQLRAADATGQVRRAMGPGWLVAAARTDPRIIPGALVYAAITIAAEVQSRWGGDGWGADRSTSDAEAAVIR
ncbi:glycosyltransferase [Flexivirga oryzae]|uniref:4,4'-diaponeurosporenoate glycosyltransferase n=1 Tax=Flexivirga oryzae TaxID=1794944 RepID=A0A839MY96_9MICO|nr:glycosyltransferase [Flexivirga oryzae]MBB2890147.1 glycosyltransferase involved in cell wall biosynthesis [Flexivirga oryzae]